MTTIDLNNISKIHFIGIGGVSMSSLAQIMHDNGYKVTGSDNSVSETVTKLISKGITVFEGQSADNIGDYDLVVYTAAIHNDNPELARARALGINCVERSVFLGSLLSDYSNRIGVCGTHGKTTTTSILALILLASEMDPTVLIGGTLPDIKSNFVSGSKKCVVFESCEYVDSFLHFPTDLPVVLNVEEDHLDYFKDINAIKASFLKYVSQAEKAVFNIDCKYTNDVKNDYRGTPITVSLKDSSANYYACNVNTDGYPSFDVYENGKLLGSLTLSVPGIHNVYNAMCAIAAARTFDISFEIIKTATEHFGGAHRRFEKIKSDKPFTIIDDYAHHPSEIKATLTAARSVCNGTLYCIFQPHTYTRTAALLDNFISALSLADQPILVDIYSAREKNEVGIYSQDISDKIEGAIYAKSFEDAALHILRHAKENDVVITMGAGNVYKIADLIK